MFDQLRHYLLYRVGLAVAGTQTTAAEQAALTRYAAGKRACVEIGVWHGANTRRIRDAMAPGGSLTGVDPFPPGRLGVSLQLGVARREIGKSRNGTYRLIRMVSAEAAREWSGPIDFLFIDADHSWEGLRTDWECWSAFVVPRGLVCLHDSRATPERSIADWGSVRYTEVVILADPRFEFVEAVESLTVLRRV